ESPGGAPGGRSGPRRPIRVVTGSETVRSADGEHSGHAFLGVSGDWAQVPVGSRCAGGEGERSGVHAADVGLPRNHSAEPVNAGLAVIIGIHEAVAPLAVTTRPCEVPGSALMTSMLTWAPAFTTMAGLVMPAMRKVSSRPPGGLART